MPRRAVELHPAQRFRAPRSIMAGVPLKSLLDRQAACLIGESLAAVVPDFSAARFARRALSGLEPLSLSERAAHFASAMMTQLPDDFACTGALLCASFGPELTTTAGNGLAVFFYLPHSQLIAAHGPGEFPASTQENYQLTKRFTAEYSLRPFLERHPERTLTVLRRWARDDNPHVRRLVSEGTRPRLPWASRLPAFQRDPRPTIELLELLADDPERYVQRSVANHLGDIAKDHPALTFAVCRRWLTQHDSPSRRWIIRHAVRLPARQGVVAAVHLRRDAARTGP